MNALIELSSKKAKELAEFVKVNELECSLHISKAQKGVVHCRVETSDEVWSYITKHLRRIQLLFDYYDEDKQNNTYTPKEQGKGD